MGFASWQRYCAASSSGRQPNFATLNRRRHLCSAGRPSHWALAHILVKYYGIVCVVVAQVEKLMIAKQHGCFDVIHCDESRQCHLYSIAPFTRYNLLSNRLYNRFDNRLYRVNGIYHFTIFTVFTARSELRKVLFLALSMNFYRAMHISGMRGIAIVIMSVRLSLTSVHCD